jgi:hypothetical protein
MNDDSERVEENIRELSKALQGKNLFRCRFPYFTREEAEKRIETFVKEEKEIMDSAQNEYAPGKNVFANFNRVAERLGVSSETACLTYALKHMDGITTWVSNGQEQRDSIHGRISDCRNYLLMLELMIQAQEEPSLIQMSS